MNETPDTELVRLRKLTFDLAKSAVEAEGHIRGLCDALALLLEEWERDYRRSFALGQNDRGVIIQGLAKQVASAIARYADAHPQ